MHREIVPSSPFLRYAIPVASSFVAAETTYAYLAHRLSLPVTALALALVAVLLWLATQFADLFVYADREGVFLAFGRIERQIARSAIKSVKPFKVTIWNAGGLGIRRGWRYEGWIARTGKGVIMELADGKKMIFSTSRPEAVVKAIKAKA